QKAGPAGIQDADLGRAVGEEPHDSGRGNQSTAIVCVLCAEANADGCIRRADRGIDRLAHDSCVSRGRTPTMIAEATSSGGSWKMPPDSPPASSFASIERRASSDVRRERFPLLRRLARISM